MKLIFGISFKFDILENLGLSIASIEIIGSFCTDTSGTKIVCRILMGQV